MKQIPLTQGKFVLVDDEDYEFLMQWRWCISHGYAMRREYPSEKSVYMHRVISKTPHDMKTDHRDGDILNNQRHNLRAATHAQNMRNSKIKPHSSQYKGVGWYEKDKRWVAKIVVDKQRKWLGCFKSEIEAAHVYDAAAKLYHGEYARLNFTPEAAA